MHALRSRWFPPALLAVLLTVLAVATHGGRLGLSFAGGALLPVGDLGEVWSEYLAAWHGVAGGVTGGAPAALAVLGVLGAPFAPVGGPSALVAVLLLGGVPLAALSAYAATRTLPVPRWGRALTAAAYGMLPPATAAAAQGRLDVVVVHVLLPLLIAGTLALLGGPVGPRWLSTSAVCALGLAFAAAFSPLTYLLLVAVASAVFVASPRRDRPRTRAGALAVLVLAPPVLLLPWLPVLAAHPALVLHGIDGPATEDPTLVELFGLDPGGPGGSPAGFVVVLAAFVAVMARPTSRMVPAVALVLLGAFSVVVGSAAHVRPVRGGASATAFAGIPLLLAGAGLLSIVLIAWARGPRPAGRRWRRVAVVGSTSAVLALCVSWLVVGRGGPLSNEPISPTAPLAAEIEATGRGLLILGDPDDSGDAPRLISGREARFGDDALPATDTMRSRVQLWQRQLLTGEPEAVTSAVTSAAASGVLYVVLPHGDDGRALSAAAQDLVEPAPRAADGRVVVRLTPEVGAATLISSEQARRSVSGLTPDAGLLTTPASVAVAAVPPEVGVRVSEGPEGRLLVLSAAYAPGWRATVDGAAAPIVLAWGGQVAVAVPPEQAEVRVWFDGDRHDLLLLGQLAAVLFTVLTALPSLRRRAARPRDTGSPRDGESDTSTEDTGDGLREDDAEGARGGDNGADKESKERDGGVIAGGAVRAPE
ncbi:hypothetical protein [Saccharomonospora xinjiangensis]|uniref:Bacterial membrane protein YfhO n=1 Tax=Saccharomonospora xinjiangensis XJ-54 TaxID=882086 RepID=I0V553_9PSEU|nr:hypothetical protein [Saccharomonospora xinjiangensis]EID55256.1 hypothetical protein SacxiDRAFT_3046 [Saccharomonospora xinjiangensis XJ-54]